MNNYNDDTKAGVLGIGYANQRKTSRALKYRLWRRTREVQKAIVKYSQIPLKNIIDLGTAEGKMIFELSKNLPETKFIGIEYNKDLADLAKKNKTENSEIIQCDVNDVHNLINQKFDVVIATAIIEHVESPEIFMKSVYEMLNTRGILILTAPDPIWEYIATKVGHLEDEQHNEVPNLKRLKELSEKANLKVELSQKFMISPIGFPMEEIIEKFMRLFGFSFMMANQLLVVRKN